MLSIFLLAILVLIQIMLVTTIFNNIKINRADPHYKIKELLLDLFELGFMVLVIYLLSLNYLEFVGVSISVANKWSLGIISVVIIGYLVINFRTLMKDFGLDVVDKVKDKVKEVRRKREEEKDISKHLAGNYNNTVSMDDRYKISKKYPFYLDSIGKPVNNHPELVSVEKPEFNNNVAQENIQVVFLDDMN